MATVAVHIKTCLRVSLDNFYALWHLHDMKLLEYLAIEQTNPNAFARKLGVPNSTVHRWVHGQRKPSMSLLPRIERVTDGKVTPRDFYPAVEAAE